MLVRLNVSTIALIALIALFAVCAPAQTAFASSSQTAIKVVVSNRASSAATPPLKIKLERRKVAVIVGKEIFQDAATAKPGDVLEDVSTYTNMSRRDLVVPNATLPVPANTELILNSVNPAPASASVDGVNYFPPPLKTKVTEANGVEVEKPVAVSQYRFLRWNTGKLAPGQSVAYSARFRIIDTETTIVKR